MKISKFILPPRFIGSFYESNSGLMTYKDINVFIITFFCGNAMAFLRASNSA